MWRFLILVTALGLGQRTWAAKLEFSLNEGHPCPEMPNYPRSSCRRHCAAMIASHILRQTLTQESVVQCNVAEQLVCCPHTLPQSPSSSTQPLKSSTHYAAVLEPPTDPQRTYAHMASLRYLSPETLDSYVYRCAALVVRVNLALTSAYCAGLDDVVKMPSRVRLGLVAPFQEELAINVGCTSSWSLHSVHLQWSLHFQGSFDYNSDLVLFRLTRNYSSEAIAKICSQQDLDSSRKLMAVGFAQKNGVNCGWFEQEVSLRPFAACNITAWSGVRGIESQTHFCVYPIHMPAATGSGSCFRCLRAGASVLHAVQADGSACVAGVATPTGGRCYNAANADLYYTSLLNGNVLDFINGSH